jgi:hypothetical protein
MVLSRAQSKDHALIQRVEVTSTNDDTDVQTEYFEEFILLKQRLASTTQLRLYNGWGKPVAIYVWIFVYIMLVSYRTTVVQSAFVLHDSITPYLYYTNKI